MFCLFYSTSSLTPTPTCSQSSKSAPQHIHQTLSKNPHQERDESKHQWIVLVCSVHTDSELRLSSETVLRTSWGDSSQTNRLGHGRWSSFVWFKWPSVCTIRKVSDRQKHFLCESALKVKLSFYQSTYHLPVVTLSAFPLGKTLCWMTLYTVFNNRILFLLITGHI